MAEKDMLNSALSPAREGGEAQAQRYKASEADLLLTQARFKKFYEGISANRIISAEESKEIQKAVTNGIAGILR